MTHFRSTRRRTGKRRNVLRKRRDPFNGKDVVYIDYKETKLLERFINDQAMILPRRITGVSAKNQRRIAEAIKRARYMAMLPYVGEGIK